MEMWRHFEAVIAPARLRGEPWSELQVAQVSGQAGWSPPFGYQPSAAVQAGKNQNWTNANYTSFRTTRFSLSCNILLTPTWPGAVACLMTCCCCWPPGGRCCTTCWPPTWGRGGSSLSHLRDNFLMAENHQPAWAPAPKQPLPPTQHQSNFHQRSSREKGKIASRKKPSYTRTATTCSNCPVEVLTIWPCWPCCCWACWAPCGLATSTCRGAIAGWALAGGKIHILCEETDFSLIRVSCSCSKKGEECCESLTYLCMDRT